MVNSVRKAVRGLPPASGGFWPDRAKLHGNQENVRLQVAVSQHSFRARIHPPMLRLRGAGRARRKGRGDRLCRLRLHRAVAAYRQFPDHDDASLAAGKRQQADRAHGWRHHHGGRSLRQGRDAADPFARGNRGKQGQHQGRVFEGPEVRRRQGRRDHGRQCRLAVEARLYRDAARRWPAFLRQPHADHGFGSPSPRARAGDELHRVQLHGLPVLRLRRTGAPVRLQPADGRVGPMGQYRQRRGTWPPHGHATSFTR